MTAMKYKPLDLVFNRLNMKFLVPILIIACISVECLAVELTGTVKSKSGKPIEGVKISDSVRRNWSTATDAEGFFKLPDHGSIIFFRHPSYRPVTRIVDAATNNLHIVMEGTADTEWVIPSCSTILGSSSRIGHSFKFIIPNDSAVERVRDIDYQEIDIGYGSGRDRVLLQVVFGLHVSGGQPPDSIILSSSEFTERSYKCGEAQGIDMRGRSKNGKYWRWIGSLFEAAFYEDVSEEAASFFDKIIDGMCCGEK